MPDASDPSFAREERRARARRAASEASAERQQELRSKYAPAPPPPPEPRRTSGGRTQARHSGPPIDAQQIAASARAALDAHPSTWTSYAELCSANGLDRSLSPVVARQLIPEPTGDHWFRIRNNDGVYDVPAGGANRGDAVRHTQAEADRALEAIGVRVVGRRADPEYKLLWMHGEWCLAAR